MSEMRIYKKVALVLCFVLAVSICTAGCSPSGGKITSPQHVKYFVENNIEVENIAEEFEEGFGEYIQISGLKDKEVEDKINEKLYGVYIEMKENGELPPYRGIKQKVKEDSLVYDYIYSCLGANINNILSVYIIENYEYRNSDGDIYYCTDSRTVNIDLNTGEEFGLADVFCDNVDYEAFLNEYVEKESFGSGDMEYGYHVSENAIKLTAPFKGISEEQKFYINGYDGSLQLIFDYDQPEVYCEYDSPVFFRVDMGENSALATRYYNENESLFESEAKKIVMLSKSFDPSKAVTEEYYEDVAIKDGTTNVWVNYTYYEDMPAGALNYAEENAKPAPGSLEEYIKGLDGYGNTYSAEDVSVEAFYSIWCNGFADYTNVEVSFRANVYSELGYELDWTTDCVYSCFKGAEYEPMELPDIFVPKADVKDIVIGAFMRNYRDYLESEGEEVSIPDEAYMESFFNEAYDRINGFMLLGSIVTFSYEDWDELVEKYFPGEDHYLYGSFCETAEYEYLGVENLVIF